LRNCAIENLPAAGLSVTQLENYPITQSSKSLVVGGSRVARVILKRCLAREKSAQSHWKPELRVTKAARNSKTKNSKILEN
jgi:hypothetical protein